MKILIVEDDILIAAHLKEIIEEMHPEYQVSCTHNETMCLANLQAESTDFVLLDIRMEANDSGLKLASKIKNQFSLQHAFITAQSDRLNMDKAFETSPLGYVVKPFRSADIYALLKLASQKHQKDFFTVSTANTTTRIPLNEIQYLKAENNYVDVVTADKKFTVRMTLSAAHAELPKERFVQTHRSYIVNKDAITIITKSHVVIQKHEIPISKAYSNNLKT